ncbi:MAG: hypothetical protein U5N58_09430 [Actinomycetota bacterium]|nr:hypothetical protein [Actinomycetota bacterium]
MKKIIRVVSAEIIVSEVTTVISAHTGPGIWGVAFSPILDY